MILIKNKYFNEIEEIFETEMEVKIVMKLEMVAPFDLCKEIKKNFLIEYCEMLEQRDENQPILTQ